MQSISSISLVWLLFLSACFGRFESSGDSGPDTDDIRDSSIDGVGDSPEEADGDADIDGDTDGDTDVDGDADGDGDGDADGDGDGDADGDGDGDADGDADSDVHVSTPGPHNLVFVTSTTQTPGSQGDLATIDALCNDLAMAAGLDGTYVAWVSSSDEDASDRLGSSRGWVRRDGRPFADQVSDIVAGKIWNPIRLDEYGEAHDRSDGSVATGTSSMGSFTQPACNDWSHTNGSTIGGSPSATTMYWTSGRSVSCNENVRFYCFGVDYSNAVTPAPAQGPVAFYSGSWTPSGGLEGADSHCQQDAENAGIPGTFKAFLATDDMVAASRFSASGAVWVRPDGIPVARSRSDLFEGRLLAPINVRTSISYVSSGAWNGFVSPNTAPVLPYNCANWTTSSDTEHGYVGTGAEAGDAAFGNSIMLCFITYGLYCLEEPE